MTKAFFFAHYTAWALIWGHVLAYYGAFARREWHAAGGSWRTMPREALGVLGFIFLPLLRDITAIARRRPLPVEVTAYRYSKAHRMGFFIAVGSVTYFVMGLTMCFYPDRSQWLFIYQLSSSTLITLTSIAGLGHLLTALDHQPRRWRWFLVAMLVYYPLAMVLFNGVTTGHFSLHAVG